MKPTYREELAELPETYRSALRVDVGPLAELSSSMAAQPALFVASGGGLAIAQLASECHIRAYGEMATAVTPLTLVGEATVRRASVVAISARAAHPDVHLALRAARARHNYPVALVTHRAIEDLDPAVTRQLSSAIHIPCRTRDGFLATNSVLLLATLFVRAASPEHDLPGNLPFTSADRPIERPRCLVLFGPGQRAAAIDLETRLSELGWAAAQVADYRNFAHGRHTGLDRNLDQTTIVAFADQDTKGIADATLATLPSTADVIRLTSPLRGEAAALDLLTASMGLTGATAALHGADPASPRVPEYGRKLYHLSTQRHTKFSHFGPVDRKLAALGTPGSQQLRARYTSHLGDWITAAKSVRLRGLVVDYDGTVCATSDRYKGPSIALKEALNGLLDDGLTLGFASGRGRSLPIELRKWIPERHWGEITVGLYSGALLLNRLDQEVPLSGEDPSREFSELEMRLRGDPLGELVKVDRRQWQMTVEPVTGAGLGVEALASWISSCAQRTPTLDVRVRASGHSVDVTTRNSSKVTVVEAVERRSGGEVLAIGDRGDNAGNDFELLACRPWTLSVDRCSADPTRCWNLAPAGTGGPDALTRYLGFMERRRSGWALKPRTM